MDENTALSYTYSTTLFLSTLTTFGFLFVSFKSELVRKSPIALVTVKTDALVHWQVSREHLLARKNLVTNFAGRVAQVNGVKVVIAGGFSGERLSTYTANEAPVTLDYLFGRQHFRSESNPS
jgi:hypothetical protein